MTLSVSRLAIVAMGAALAIAALTDPATPRERPGVLAFPQAKFYGYGTPVVVVQQGEKGVTFTNLDLEKHDVVQDVATDGFGSKKPLPWCETKKHGGGHHHHDEACPLFWSKLIGLGDTTRIRGLDKLESGVYSFFCTLHHGMKGKLIVG